MSHSKMSKRGESKYVDSWCPDAKRQIVACSLCGHKGFHPRVLEEGFFTNTNEGCFIRKSLESVLEPLELDEFGCCPICASHRKQ